MATIKLKAYPQSISEWETLWKKFPAFAAAKVTKNAEKQWVYKDSELGTGSNWLRNASADSSSGVCAVLPYGTRNWNPSFFNNLCSRVALQIIYNPEFDLVKGCKKSTRTQRVLFNKNGTAVWDYDRDNMQEKEVTSTADVVFSGKSRKPYLWLNKAKCKSGKDVAMKLVEMDAHEHCPAFYPYENENDFAGAEEIHEQYKKIIEEDFTKEELAMVIEMEMSKKGNYDTASPVFTSEQQKIVDKVQNTIKGKGMGD